METVSAIPVEAGALARRTTVGRSGWTAPGAATASGATRARWRRADRPGGPRARWAFPLSLGTHALVLGAALLLGPWAGDSDAELGGVQVTLMSADWSDEIEVLPEEEVLPTEDPRETEDAIAEVTPPADLQPVAEEDEVLEPLPETAQDAPPLPGISVPTAVARLRIRVPPPPPAPLPPPPVRRTDVLATAAPPVRSAPRLPPPGAGMVERPRRLSTNLPPRYPAELRAAGIEGQVLLRVRISADGAVTEAAIHQTSGYGAFDQAALDAVRGWRYTPARLGGVPVSRVYVIPVTFRMT